MLSPSEESPGADYYSCHEVAEDDQLRHDNVNDAVEDELDNTPIEKWPEKLVVMGYVEVDDDYVEDPPPAGETYYINDEEYDVTIVVAEWVKEHAQHWLKEPEVVTWVSLHKNEE